ncbi:MULTISPECIES: hypothetical protein [unclassified Streptomyces]|uniref:hypothetical protein n=1 Tax=unclassified Streptomyces TaxID=2593676 RepID=UPI00081EBEFD|nr:MULTISPECIES: hypothetical protein [unclassified Streptomyces]MYR27795.1 hypothetical protein [Streptomyces sp. SID4945]SCF29467.1 hypothetical protein GA0115257_110318 [Streptomyces sp. LcepLS]
MTSHDPNGNDAPLRDVAASPEATARYLADVQRVLLSIGHNLDTLADETRVHLRRTRVEGDKFWHARKRALPVERALKQVQNSLDRLTGGLETAAHRRHAHDENVAATAEKRAQDALKKAAKRQQIPARPTHPPTNSQSGTGQNAGNAYSEVTSIYDLGKRRSA